MSIKFGFIIGTGRCGTSWLGQMLNSQMEICVPPEIQCLFEYSGNGNRLFEEFALSRRVNFSGGELASIIERSCPHDFKLFFDYEDFCSKEDTPKGSPEEFASAFYSAIAWHHGKSWLIEQTPWYGQRIDLLLRFFPQAKIIHMVRDGRDVALSFARTNWWTKSPQDNLVRWQKEIKKITIDARYLVDKNSYLEIKYENLVSDTRAQLQKVCDFLGVKFEKRMLDSSKFIDYEQFSKIDGSGVWSSGYSVWRERKDGPSFSDSVAAWRRSSELFQTPLPQQISEWLTHYGYDVGGISLAERQAVELAYAERRNSSHMTSSPKDFGERAINQAATPRTGLVDERNDDPQGAEMQKNEKVLVFPGLLRLLNDIGSKELDVNGVPVNYGAVRRLLIPVLRRSLRVNEAEVLRLYPKVKSAFDRGDIVNLSEYITNEGYFDGVVPVKIPFDEGFYLSEYDDVRSAVSSGTITAKEHWLFWGYREGRLPSPSVSYLDANRFLQ